MAEEYPDFTGGDAPSSTSRTYSKRRSGTSAAARAMGGSGEMGKHTRAARSADLKLARWALFAVAVLSIVEGGYALLLTETKIEVAVTQQRAINYQNPNAGLSSVKEAVILVIQILCIAYILFGVLFLGLAALIGKFPVSVTITGLILYSGMTLGFFLFSPAAIPYAFFLKIFLFIALVMGIMAAFSFKRDEEASRRKAAREGEVAAELA